MFQHMPRKREDKKSPPHCNCKKANRDDSDDETDMEIDEPDMVETDENEDSDDDDFKVVLVTWIT